MQLLLVIANGSGWWQSMQPSEPRSRKQAIMKRFKSFRAIAIPSVFAIAAR